jgi:hypothetical protein
VAKKYVYYFGDGLAEGTSNMKELLGGKGAGRISASPFRPASRFPPRPASNIIRTENSILPACGTPR